jgi:hypothetical protein
MDAGLAAATRALRAGDPLGALPRVALRDDAPALALRGIAMAQLGDLRRAKALLRAARRAFGPEAPRARARCVVALAEVSLAARELARWPDAAVEDAARVLARGGDHENALHARLLAARRLLLIGRVDHAEGLTAGLTLDGAPPALRAVAALVAWDLAIRRGRSDPARRALERARRAATASGIPALQAEVAQAAETLAAPAARLLEGGVERALILAEVEAVRRSPRLLVDACRRRVVAAGALLDLSRRPVLFALLRALAEAWPGSAARETLAGRAFGAARLNPSLRVRLRVDLGRLRAALRGLAGIAATPLGFALAPQQGRPVAVLAPPVEGEGGAILALLADGEPWATSGLALALGASPRSVQRALAALAERGSVHSLGRGRSRRWLWRPPGGLSTALVPGAPPPRGAGLWRGLLLPPPQAGG